VEKRTAENNDLHEQLRKSNDRDNDLRGASQFPVAGEMEICPLFTVAPEFVPELL